MAKRHRSDTPQPAVHRRLGLSLVTLDGREERDDVGVEITIDGISLLTLVRDAETRVGGDPEGAYWAASLENLWLVEEGDGGRWFRAVPGVLGDGGFAPLLVCECGDPWCWGFYATVRVDGDTVSWSDFCHTVSERFNAARYRSIGPLLFERRAYFKALARLEPGIGSVVKRRNAGWANAMEAKRRARGRAVRGRADGIK
ncbi:MAG: hypothetical protein AAF637_10940 [Pseudomonadota bacterium]